MKNFLDAIDSLQYLYSGWLRGKITIADHAHGWVVITTPFLDRRNDCIQLYARWKGKDEILLSDHGYTLEDSIGMAGRVIDKDELKVILNGFGVKRKKDSLEISTSHGDFPLKQNNLIQAMIAIDFAARRAAK